MEVVSKNYDNNNKDEELITFKKIKSVKVKKQLLNNYVEKFNYNIEDEIKKQKNKLLFKSLCINLKHINEDNILLKENDIIYIIGIYENNGLFFISDILYKKNKVPK